MENLTMPQKMFLIILGIIVVIILVVYVFTRENSTAYFESEIIGENTSITQYNEVKEESIIIHIAGQVVDEGIIELPVNSRLYEAVEAAGGVTAEADLSQINLAIPLQDGQKIYIPSVEEVENGYIENINGQNYNKEVGKIDINTASQSELETISGIGPSTALKIINYRKENGNFINIEDIKNVPGIGDAKYESIKDSIIVN